MKKGIRFHDVNLPTTEESVEFCKNNKIDYIQLVLEKSIEGHAKKPFSKEYALKLKSKFDPLKIAVLGCYINPSSLDEDFLELELQKFEKAIRFASILNPIVVGTETGFCGSACSELDGSEFAYQHLLKSLKRLVKVAESYKVHIGIEGVHCFVINTPKKMKRLLDDLSSEWVKVIFDPINYITLANYQEQDTIISDAFTLFGDKIAVIHAKDFVVDGTELKRVELGKGLLNYKLIFENVKKNNLDVPVISEEYSKEVAVKGLKWIQEVINSTTI